ncbi:MAG TPA: hypothetical protein VGL29_19760 [Blastocatellia bacterium]|jgi:hypothetical protein
MNRTAADVRQTVVPSSSLLPYAHVGFSIATKQAYSREFFNGIGRSRPDEGNVDLTLDARSNLDYDELVRSSQAA